MSSDNKTQHEWPACPPGEVSRLAGRLQGHRRAVVRQQRVVAGLLVLLLAVTGYYFVGVLPHARPGLGGIACGEVHDLMPQYVANQLDAAKSARIHKHLQRCKKCRVAKEEMAPESAPHSDSANNPTPGAAARQTAAHDEFLRVAIDGFALLDR